MGKQLGGRIGKSNIDLRQQAMLVALVAISVLFQILTGGVTFRAMNLSKLIMQNSYVLILAIGMLPCVLTGNVDLSVGSVVALVSAVCGHLIVNLQMPVMPTVLIAMCCGILMGAFQGFWIAYIRIPAFIVTLAGMLIFRGFTMIILQGRTLAPFPDSYSYMAAGYLSRHLVGTVDMVAVIIGILCAILLVMGTVVDRLKASKLNAKKDSVAVFVVKIAAECFIPIFITYWLGTYNGIPCVLLLLVALVLIYSFITGKTVIGRHLYAMGGNEKAARLSGIDTNRIFFLAYVNSAFVAAVAGIIFSGRLNAATPTAGNSFELDAIAACYIGGASATGGVGTVIGAVIGGLVMGILNNGMSIMGIGSDWQQTIKGFVLLAAVAFDIISKRKR